MGAENERQGKAGEAAVEVTTVGDVEDHVQRQAERDDEPPAVDPDRNPALLISIGSDDPSSPRVFIDSGFSSTALAWSSDGDGDGVMYRRADGRARQRQ